MWSQRCSSSSVATSGPPSTTCTASGSRCVAEQVGQDRGGGRRQLGGLDHGGVAGGQRGGQRLDQQLHGVVPGGDDQHRAQGLGLDAAPTRHGGEGQADAAGLGPLGHVLAEQADLGRGDAEVRGPALHRRLADVGGQRGQQPVLALVQQSDEGIELALAPLDRTGDPPLEGGPGGGDRGRRPGRQAGPMLRWGSRWRRRGWSPWWPWGDVYPVIGDPRPAVRAGRRRPRDGGPCRPASPGRPGPGRCPRAGRRCGRRPC